jgi:hypothetical protein
MSINQLSAHRAALPTFTPDDRNFGSLVRQAAPGARRREDIVVRERVNAQELRSLDAQSRELDRQQAEITQANQEEARARLRQQQAQAVLEAAMEREQRATRAAPPRLP